jgi:hypothetical protein
MYILNMKRKISFKVPSLITILLLLIIVYIGYMFLEKITDKHIEGFSVNDTDNKSQCKTCSVNVDMNTLM